MHLVFICPDTDSQWGPMCFTQEINANRFGKNFSNRYYVNLASNQCNIHCYSSLQCEFNCFIGLIILMKNKTPYYYLLLMAEFHKTACLGRNALLYRWVYPVWLKVECIANASPLIVTAMWFVSCDSKQS